MKKSTKLQGWALLAYVLFLIFYVVAFSGCKKSEVIEPKLETQYEIEYFVVSDSSYIQYNVDSIICQGHIKDWDTTFYYHGGWTINVMVTSFSSDLLTGIVIDGDTLDGCLCGDWCLMGFYLK